MSKEEKKELVTLLPISLQKSKEFTDNQKLVLGFLIYKNGMDKVEKDGYFFATNESISNELGISVKSIIAITKKFINLNFISRKSGHKHVATEYIVYEDKINSYINVYPNVEGKGKGKPIKEGKGNEIEKLTNTIELLINKINKLEDEIKSLKVKVNETYVYPISKVNLKVKVNPDTDTEKDIDKDINKKEYILGPNINKKILNNKNNINNNILKESKGNETPSVQINKNKVEISSNVVNNQDTPNKAISRRFKEFLNENNITTSNERENGLESLKISLDEDERINILKNVSSIKKRLSKSKDEISLNECANAIEYINNINKIYYNDNQIYSYINWINQRLKYCYN